MSRFAKNWEQKRSPSLGTKIKESIVTPAPIKARLESSIKRIEVQVQSLSKSYEYFSDRDKSIFNSVVEAYTNHDETRANIFANELTEIRKIRKMILHAKLALEQIGIRLRTITELGDIAVTLTPVIGVIYKIREGMSAVSPQAEHELGEIGSLLGGIVVDAGQVAGIGISFDTINESSQKILNEAAVVAEQRMTDKFPQLSPPISPTRSEEAIKRI